MDKKKQGSPGRYSIAEEGEGVPPMRIDSTTRMPAVRPDMFPPKSSPQAPPLPPPPSTARLPETGKKLPPMPPPPNRTAPMPTRAATPPPPPPSAKARRSEPDRDPEPEPESAAPDTTPEASKPVVKAGLPAGALSSSAHRASSRPPRAAASSFPPPRRVSSLRPPMTSAKISMPPPALETFSFDGFDEGSIAFAFDALVSDGPTGEAGKHEFDLAPVRELFAELAANHMRHVRDFMIDVKWGEVTRDWIHICIPPVRTLARAAKHLELVELDAALLKLGDELDASNAVGGQMLDTGEKQRLLDAYGALVELLPQAFALDGDRTQREAVIVQALLLQVPDVRKVTIDKLHAAGLTSLSVLFEANAGDIAHVAGIQDVLAARIVERLQAYRAELQSASPQDARAAEREKLATLSRQLKQHHVAYEEAADGWTSDAKMRKRDSFRAREEKWLEISVVLARFGEVERLQGIEKVPFSQRIAQLADYLEEARDKYRAAEG